MTHEWEKYTKYLSDIVYLNEFRNYNKLLSTLNTIEFIWSIDFDENRALDGYDLRLDYQDEYEVELVGNATVLEVLVALARRIDEEYIGTPGEEHPEMIFWEMICNLGFVGLSDNHYREEPVVRGIDKWMERRFGPDGLWSIFPLGHTDRDQRKIEIWAQMLEYISEKYV